ncbi:uroporphyrinogen-III synthase [Halarchaeum rubridurum]|uniref:Uroporphyrinogen-III synthase n=1 Tax=Halarchaeum rubridurum TaxID=489911 RepID=A0A830G3V5_9EURY|nr:uroporphyrinogen-III synthase [Halarchaeum rubridurum]MBP1955803.1 uroporphyrinogen-III synthase [Halarchaeum rubridurum]GGM74348.1 uroporphyrinogen-III synthase [Halarchaeum rubridurum]
MTQAVRAAVFRPDDGRLDAAVELLESLGATPVPDAMLAVEPTRTSAREDGDYAVFTSKTGVELVAETGWEPGAATVCAIGERTADALREAGYDVDLVPAEFSSSGLVDALEDVVDGARVEVARSDHGSAVLTDGLEDAGAYVHETVLYRLVRPPEAGVSAERAAAGELEAALFTSSLTVEHFLEAAAARGVRDDALAGLNDAVVGCIGEPTARTAERHGVDVDVIPGEASFDALAAAVVEAAAPSRHE